MSETQSPLHLAAALTELWSPRVVELGEGEMFVVPKGVRHHPVAEGGCLLMLFERMSTLHTGDVQTEHTRSIEEQLRPLAGQST